MRHWKPSLRATTISTARSVGGIHHSCAATPTFSPGAGTYSTIQTVTISDTTPSATIYYTTNGTTPTTGSTVYSSCNHVSAIGDLEAHCYRGYGYTAQRGRLGSIHHRLPTAATPTFSPCSRNLLPAQTVTISDTTPSATIYYTTNGNTPTTSSSVYSSAISVSADETLEAIAAIEQLRR